MRNENEINKNKTFTVSINKSISRCGLLFFCTKKSITDYYVTIEAEEEASEVVREFVSWMRIFVSH